MEMKKIAIIILLFSLMGCARDGIKTTYVIGIGINEDISKEVYFMLLNESKGEEEYKVIKGEGNTIEEIIKNLEEKYFIMLELKTTLLILTNSKNKIELLNIIESYDLEYDTEIAYSKDIPAIFSSNSPTLVDDLLHFLKNKDTVLSFINSNENIQILSFDGKELFVNNEYLSE